VLFAGPTKDLQRYYQDAALFALPSRYEGFPNALLEAMACGCAVISTACPGGTAEIVRHDIDGVLVPPNDVTALATEMERLMRDESERKRLGDRAVESSLRFRPDGILALWDSLFSDVGVVREVV